MGKSTGEIRSIVAYICADIEDRVTIANRRGQHFQFKHVLSWLILFVAQGCADELVAVMREETHPLPEDSRLTERNIISQGGAAAKPSPQSFQSVFKPNYHVKNPLRL